MSASAIEERRGSTPVVQSLRRFGRWSGAAAALFGAVVLLGWVVGSDLLRSFLPAHVQTKANTALALMLAGAAQWLSATPDRPGRRSVVRVLLLGVVLISGATLLQFLLGRDFGIDQWFFREATGAVGTPYPGRMSLLAIVEFLLFAVTLELRAWRRRSERWAEWTAVAGLSVGLMVLLGYTFGAHTLYALGWNTAIALPTALAFAVLFAGVLAAQPESGWMAIVISRGPGGVLLRRLLPLAIAGPWVIGWLSLVGSDVGLFSTSADQVVVVLPLIFLLVAFLYQSARVLERLDEEREQRKRDVESLNQELEGRVQERTVELLAANAQLSTASRYARNLIEASLDPLVTIGKDGRIMDVNLATEEVTGRSRPELIGSDFSEYFTEPELARRGYQQAFERGLVHDYPLTIRHRDGPLTEVLYNAAVYRDEAGEVHGVFAAARDITERKRAEGQARAASRYARSLIEASLDPLVTISKDGRIMDVNRATEEITGRSRQELVGSDFSEYFTEPELARRGYQQVFDQGLVRDYPLAIRHREGRVTDVLYNATVFRNEAGEVEGVFAAARDISTIRRAQKELSRLNRALKALSRCSDAVARASDESALLQRVCDLIVQIGGYPLAWVGYAEDDEQRTVTPVAVGGFGAEYVRAAHITWADTERGRGPTGIAIRTGRPCCVGDIVADPRFTPWRDAALRQGYASVMAAPLKEGERSFGALNLYAPEPNAFDREEQELVLELAATLSYGILALRARGERDQAAAELRHLNETLERRVAERTAELAASIEEMEAFTYSVSHDLRAPLRHIDGFSKVLLDQCSEHLDDLGRHYLERVRHATQQMGRLVDDLLNLSHIGRRPLHLEETALGLMVREIADELQAEAGARAIEWRIASLPVANCDPNLIRQVFFNLLSNAVKFTRQRAPAVIEVGVEGEELFVRDNGVGFDARYADKLFGVFQRLHRSEEFEGTGVGLATVRRILRKHGGDIHGEGAPGKGATFHFTLGRPEAASGAREAEAMHVVS